jgi:hypothetical protein
MGRAFTIGELNLFTPWPHHKGILHDLSSHISEPLAERWAGLAPMSGPFVQALGYPWENLSTMPLLVTEGTGATPSLTVSRVLRDWLKERNFDVTYKEVNADHAGMVPLALPDVFQFFADLVR